MRISLQQTSSEMNSMPLSQYRLRGIFQSVCLLCLLTYDNNVSKSRPPPDDIHLRLRIDADKAQKDTQFDHLLSLSGIIDGA